MHIHDVLSTTHSHNNLFHEVCSYFVVFLNLCRILKQQFIVQTGCRLLVDLAQENSELGKFVDLLWAFITFLSPFLLPCFQLSIMVSCSFSYLVHVDFVSELNIKLFSYYENILVRPPQALIITKFLEIQQGGIIFEACPISWFSVKHTMRKYEKQYLCSSFICDEEQLFLSVAGLNKLHQVILMNMNI